jgi:hypothetical protein
LCQPLPSATIRLQPLYGGSRRGAVPVDHLAQGRPCRQGDSGLDQAGVACSPKTGPANKGDSG